MLQSLVYLNIIIITVQGSVVYINTNNSKCNKQRSNVVKSICVDLLPCAYHCKFSYGTTLCPKSGNFCSLSLRSCADVYIYLHPPRAAGIFILFFLYLLDSHTILGSYSKNPTIKILVIDAEFQSIC